MIAQNGSLAIPANQVYARSGIASVPDHVTEAIYRVNTMLLNLPEGGRQGVKIGMNVTN